MFVNFFIIVMIAMLVGLIMNKIKLPSLLGMLLLGIIIGPHGTNLIHPTIIQLSPELRKMALIIILLRAGLGLNKNALKQIGSTAIKMSFIPGVIEGLTIMFIATKLLGFSYIQGGILGFIIAAVSPAVVVPQMIKLKEKKLGEDKHISTLILAGASVDDVVAITIYTSFMALYFGKDINLIGQLVMIPVSIIFGVFFGICIGLILNKLFNTYKFRDTKKIIILIGISVIFNYIETKFQVATLIGIMTIGFIILEKSEQLGVRLSAKLNKVWILAEIVLFVLIGAEVDISVVSDNWIIGAIIIIVGLIFRSVGVIIATKSTNLNIKEKLFCIIAYWPKATVQAAIGAVPLSMGVVSGEVILTIAVEAILITAPLGAILIHLTAPKLLKKS